MIRLSRASGVPRRGDLRLALDGDSRSRERARRGVISTITSPFRRWMRVRIWDVLPAALNRRGDGQDSVTMIDSTIVRVQQACGCGGKSRRYLSSRSTSLKYGMTDASISPTFASNVVVGSGRRPSPAVQRNHCAGPRTAAARR